MIVVEGPDGGGKSTLIRDLSERYMFPIAPRVVSKDTDAMVDLKAWVEDNTLQGFQYKFFDRHRLISEPIYGPILRDQIQPGFDDVSWLGWQMRLFYQAKPIIIFCIPPLEAVRANVIGDGEDNKVVRSRIDKIYSAYVARATIDEFFRPGRTMIYDYTSDGREDNPMTIFDRFLDQYIAGYTRYKERDQ